VEVEVSRPQKSSGLVLRGPHGVSVEGLSVSELSELLRKLS